MDHQIMTGAVDGEGSLETKDRLSRSPLSFAQERLWFLQKLDPLDTSYNLTRAFRLRGALDREALERALTALAWRHELLRSRFPAAVDGTPYQEVLGRPALRLRHERLAGGHGVEAVDGAIVECIEAEAAHVFELEAAPPYRAVLIEAGPDDAVLILSMHHMLSDGSSNAIWVKDLLAAYGAALAGPGRAAEALLPPASTQYAGYVRQQRDADRPGHLSAALDRAVERLQDGVAGTPSAIPVLDLPPDRPRPASGSRAGGRVDFTLSAELVSRVRAFAQAEGCTPFVIILAAWAILLARRSGQSDFAIGVPNAGRWEEEFEDVVGFFVETEVYRLRLRAGMTGRDLVRALRADVRSMLDDGPVPFEKLLERLPGIDRGNGRTPLFQTMVNIQMDAHAELSLPGLSVELIETPERTAKFELSLNVAYSAAGVRCSIEYASAVFDETTVEAMGRQFAMLLDSLSCDAGAAWDALPMWDAQERDASLACGRGPAADIDRSQDMMALFEEWAARQPHATAAICGDDSISYGDLNARANRLAHALGKVGVAAESLVGVGLARGLDMLAALLAIGKAGGAYVPLDPGQPEARIDLIRSRAQPLLTLDSPLDGLLCEAEGAAQGNPAPPYCMRQLAYGLYTSGSTGAPKGVGIERRAFANFLAAMKGLVPMGPGDRLLAVTTLGFDIAGLELFLPLVCGAAVVIAPQEAAGDPLALCELIRRHNIGVMQATPATWRLLLDGSDARWPGLRGLCGGEALGASLAARLLERGVDLINVYGPTETTVWSSAFPVKEGEASGASVPIGAPIANTVLYILDDRMEPVPPGVVGELWIGGEGLARGYVGDPALTAEAFRPDPFAGAGSGARLYRTGDRVRRRPDGSIEFLGRRDHQVKIRGYRVEPAEIEAVLERHEAVSQAVVTARADATGEVTLAAYVLAPAGQSVAELRSHAEACLPRYMIPDLWAVLDSFPLNASGKVDRAALPAIAAEAAVATLQDQPVSQTETRLLALWHDVLDRTGFGVTDNFFEVGGHSLRLARLQTRIGKEFGVALPLQSLFRAPTVRDMGQLIDGHAPVDAAADLAFMSNLLETL
ncbi:non-ribosomal peptide synthetase [Novosphingobium beihaiensis]|uniref:Amino acid adenylation domain-containing protein n=1 Tax=Novosphingobium beihaiensis TaxID=2930389 RepID=A0ABT0BTB7_9SPHN|nr:amino acid adenylation domain-containing protein [Novosphingobium beihaiensis]MCJ2188287.1 amino acid adenylation domain-containing protein [Novosphingobium beihaiensis]